MGAVPPTTIEEKIVNQLNAHGDREIVFAAVRRYRDILRQSITDSLWECFIHDEYDRECLECKDAREVNIIIEKILQLNPLNESPYSST